MKKILILTLTMILIMTGCQSNVQPVDTASQFEKFQAFENPDDFIDVTSLKTAIENNQPMIIIDARGEGPFNKGHIQGSQPMSWQSISQTATLTPGEKDFGVLLNPEDLSNKLSAFGLNKEQDIIVYADTINGWGEDARIMWSLNMAGFNNVKLLDGGINQWEAMAYPLTKETIDIEPTEIAIEQFEEGYTISTETLMANYDDYIVIDTREKDEYEGATKFGEAKGGHLPGAINITFNQFLNEDGTVKSPEDIQSILETHHIKTTDPIVTYCTAGIRSAHMSTILNQLGYDAVNYDASFYEWAADESKELEK